MYSISKSFLPYHHQYTVLRYYYKQLNPTEGFDKVTEEIVVTEGYFSGKVGILSAINIYTGSNADTNEKYFYTIADQPQLSSSAADQFSVAFGERRGSGSYVDNNGNGVGASELIYKQFAELLLPDQFVSGGFYISAGGRDNSAQYTKPNNSALSAGTRDDYIWILVGKRARYKESIDIKT